MQNEWVEDRTNATNKLNKYINKVIPKIMDILKNDIELKNDGTLYKKCNDKIDNIIGYKKRPKNIRCYIDQNKYHGCLMFDISFKTSQFSNDYIKDYVYLWTNKQNWQDDKGDFIINKTDLSTSFIKRPIKTLKQVLNVINKTNKLNAKIELLNSKKNDLKIGFNNYLKR